ncbi:pentapeptide repeat-containing protein [Okeania sp.]|uniref:pentapeptide repeat-containing protein n=1 Tax=Okeania sp. TaxID=3100323 RepID=UPI0035C9362C
MRLLYESSGLNLSGASLRNANLKWADLKEAILERVIFAQNEKIYLKLTIFLTPES